MYRSLPILVCLSGCDTSTDTTDEPAGNALPSLARATISPADPLRTDVLTAQPGDTSDTSDADGDEVTLSYAWMLNGELGTESTLGPDVVRKDDVVELIITPNDGTEDGPAVRSSTVTGANNAPQIDKVAISPGPLRTDDTAQATVESSDWDGDGVTVQYEWFVNGEAAGGSFSLDGTSAFDRGDKVQVVVVGNDGQQATAEVSSTEVTVGNTAPTEPTLAITPSEPAPGQAVVCSPDVPSVDADHDRIGAAPDLPRQSERWHRRQPHRQPQRGHPTRAARR